MLASCAAAGIPAVVHSSSPVASLIVLTDTGVRRDGLPVLARHPTPDAVQEVLSRGYAARLLALFHLEQRFVGRTVEPAYLLLSDNQGGFPRFGFYLDGVKHPNTAYVDLHRRSALSGRPGAIDQIFPHELLHIIVFHLAGDAPEGRASQVHALGVATDRITAFNEGFAEHAQVMAIDDPDAVPATRAIATDTALRARAFDDFDAYRRALAARWSVAPKARMTFPFWFSRGEQVLRYHAVQENLFAHRPDIPDRLYAPPRAYEAYLLENVLPGQPEGAPKSPSRLLASEGVVSALFVRFVTAPAIQNRQRESGFYSRFGADPSSLAPLDNAYLKLFAAIHASGYDAAAVIEAYSRLFPDERETVAGILRSTLLGQEPPTATALWLLNNAFAVGTSLFDQFRGLPRPYAFDLNACSEADLIGVPGMDRSLAKAIVEHAPFHELDDLRRVPGMRPEMMATFARMRAASEAPPAPGTSQEGELSLKRVLMPYAWRALQIWLVSTLGAMALYRLVRRLSWWRLALNGLMGAAVGLVAGWTIDPGFGLLALAAPVAAFGLPGSVMRLSRSRSGREALRVLAAWTAVGLVAALAVTPLW
jgi:hypothetical protein